MVVELTKDLHLKEVIYKNKPAIIYIINRNVYAFQDYYGSKFTKDNKIMYNTNYNRYEYIGNINSIDIINLNINTILNSWWW